MVELVEKVGCSCSLLWRWDVEVVGEVVVGTLVRVAALLFSWVWLVLLLGGKLLQRLWSSDGLVLCSLEMCLEVGM